MSDKRIRLAVISDVHVLGPGERVHSEAAAEALHNHVPWWRGKWRKGLHHLRRRFWNWHHEPREECFLKALDSVDEYNPDWVIANGDYGGDTAGIGLSDEHTFESALRVIRIIRERFPDRCRFVFGDHELGKYATDLKSGGIRLQSLIRGEQELGIRSFWHIEHGGIDLIGVNSSLFTLDLFLPEALEDEIPQWKDIREKHMTEVSETFNRLPGNSRILLFCHDPSALSVIAELDAVKDRMDNIEYTILGHLHAPVLLKVARLMSGLPRWNPKYPVARIISNGLRGVESWETFNPIVCPSTFGTGQHFSGGVLFIESTANEELAIVRHRVRLDA